MPSYPRSLVTPTLDVGAFASRLTARSSHPHTLAALASDAASGHVAQRWSFSRVTDATHQWFYESASTARYLRASATVARTGTWTAPDGVLLTLTVTDGTTTVSTAPGVPAGLLGDASLMPGVVPVSWPRLDSAATASWVIDLDELRALLTASTLWRWSLTVASDTTAVLETWTLEELPRYLINTSDGHGQPPQDYLPRGIVRDGAAGLQRLGVTLEYAYDRSLRTYHAMSRDEATPWSTTSTAFAALAQDTETGGGAMRWRVRGRRLRGNTECRARLYLRYKTAGLTAGHTATVRVNTGAAATPFGAVLADTLGAWTDASPLTVRLLTSGTDGLDTITFEAKTESGTLSVAARTLLDYPET